MFFEVVYGASDRHTHGMQGADGRGHDGRTHVLELGATAEDAMRCGS